MTEWVRVEVDGHVATVTLARPEKHNALDVPMFEALLGAADRLQAESGVRAVVLHGEGPSFCSGLDFPSILGGEGGVGGFVEWVRGDGSAVANRVQRAALGWLQLPIPVIAALHGHCLGGGLQIALAADLRIAAPDARLSIMEVRRGLIPDMSITCTLPRLVSIDIAKELTFTGRVVSGQEAAQLGLVTRVADEPLAAARELAEQIAAQPPDAVQAAKRLYNEGWDAPAQQSLGLEAELQLRLLGSASRIAPLGDAAAGGSARRSRLG